MPYRIDVQDPPDDAFDRLVAAGAIDVEVVDNGVAALLPDAISPSEVERLLGGATVRVSAAVGRDEDSVWVLTPRMVTAGGFSIVPHTAPPGPGVLRLTDGPAFGTGLHPTTALCLETIREAVAVTHPERMLDVGTGSGLLALAALTLGVPHAVGIEIDEAAIAVAAENARINAFSSRLHLVIGGPASLRGRWPLVVANVLAAPLIDMAPAIVERVAHGGWLVLSGIPSGVAPDLERTYRNLGMRPRATESRAGWSVLVLHPTW